MQRHYTESVLKSRDITLLAKVHIVKAMVFPVVMYGCESWTIKAESPLNSKDTKPVNHKWNQPWIFFGRPDAEAEALIGWPPDAKSWLTGKDTDAGKDWGQEKKGKTKGEMVGWHHWLNGRVWANSRRQWRIEKPGMLQLMGVSKSWTRLSNWTTPTTYGRNQGGLVAKPGWLLNQRTPTASHDWTSLAILY